MVRKDLHEENRLTWNAATDAHNSHKRDQATFFREGGMTLFPEEIELLGDVAGLSLLHLQCNAGQDTLSLALRGAVVTGVDISDTAISFARWLSAEARIPASFHRRDIYDWLDEAIYSSQRWDVVFSSYGVTFWLSDLDMWAQDIAAVLKPGGRFVIVDFHPFAAIFDYDWNLKFPYFAEGQVFTCKSGISDYVAAAGTALTPSGYLEGVKNFQNPYRCHEFLWGIGQIITSLLTAGLNLAVFKEYPYSNGAIFKFPKISNDSNAVLRNVSYTIDKREIPGCRMIPPESIPSLPLMYALVAYKPS
jgi:SAM-dependent methyltransferase